MKKLALLMAIGALLSGCVAYEVPGEGRGYDRDGRGYDRDGRVYDRDGRATTRSRDRDGDGVPNRQDSRPDDPRRY